MEGNWIVLRRYMSLCAIKIITHRTVSSFSPFAALDPFPILLSPDLCYRSLASADNITQCSRLLHYHLSLATKDHCYMSSGSCLLLLRKTPYSTMMALVTWLPLNCSESYQGSELLYTFRPGKERVLSVSVHYSWMSFLIPPTFL